MIKKLVGKTERKSMKIYRTHHDVGECFAVFTMTGGFAFGTKVKNLKKENPKIELMSEDYMVHQNERDRLADGVYIEGHDIFISYDDYKLPYVNKLQSGFPRDEFSEKINQMKAELEVGFTEFVKKNGVDKYKKYLICTDQDPRIRDVL